MTNSASLGDSVFADLRTLPRTWKNPGFPQADGFPVVQISWHDASAFCEWLSRKENARYRLPTEAEWEYACRATSPTVAGFGDRQRDTPWCANAEDTTSLSAFARSAQMGMWSDGFVHAAPVGSFLPNAWGLFDMHGNAAEWCSDWYDAGYYKHAPTDDPPGPVSGIDRVCRGGSWFANFAHCRSSARAFGNPAGSTSQSGFRVVREMP